MRHPSPIPGPRRRTREDRYARRPSWERVGLETPDRSQPVAILFRVLWMGDIPIDRIELHYDPSDVLDLSDAERLDMERRWSALVQGQPHIYDAPLCRLTSWRRRGSGLEIRAGATSYKEYQGLKAAQSVPATRTPPSRTARPIAVCAVALTADGHVIMQHRSSMVGDHGGFWHVTPSGHLHPPQTFADALFAELEEELGVLRHEVMHEPRATGFVKDLTTGKPELTMLIQLGIGAATVMARKAIDSWESQRLDAIPWTEEGVGGWLKASSHRTVPNGIAALLLAGRITFGEQWMEATLGSLFRSGPCIPYAA